MPLELRRAEPSDAAAFARVMGDEAAYSGTLQLPFPSEEIWRQRLATPKLDEPVLVAMVDGEIVGQGGLHAAATSPRRAHARILGMAVHSRYHGQGVGRALMAALVDLADNWLPVTRLELTVFTDNERAIALYRKFGFEVEGTHRGYALRAGRFTDVHTMARIRPKGG